MLVVMVCTANLCRSPFAEQVLDRMLRERGVDCVVRSTGVDVMAGSSPPASWVTVAAEHAIDLRDHRSTPPESLLAEADLVLTMTADHLRDIAMGWPRLVGRAATIGEAAALAAQGAPLVARRTGRDVLATRRDLDVEDPVGRSRRVQRAVATHLVELCRDLAGGWVPQ